MDCAGEHQGDSRLGPTLLVILASLLLPLTAVAADAHRAVKQKPGEIVLLRNVSARPAYRPAPPGMALIVNPLPRRELVRALGTDELSDADYASLDASSPGNRGRATTVEKIVGNALGGSVGGSRAASGVTGNSFSSLIGSSTGTVTRTTGNINNQIQGALSQLPGMPPAPGTGQ